MKRKKHHIVVHRGRFQAQGEELEQSRAWASPDIPSKIDGKNYLSELKKRLKPAELKARHVCFERASKWVSQAPSMGYVAYSTIKTSFLPSPPVKDIRVDGEVFSGVAFKD